MQLAQHFEQVREFHLANHQYVGLWDGQQMPPSTKLLRVRLMLEELAEMTIAMHHGDAIGTVDGLTDFAYVVFGTAVSAGIPLGEFYIKHLEDARNPIYWRGIDWIDAELKIRIISKLNRSLMFLIEAIYSGEQRDIQSPLEILVTRIYHAANQMGIPLRACFNEVHRSNMTKKLGGAKDGKKYGDGGGKGESYSPPALIPILEAARPPEVKRAGV